MTGSGADLGLGPGIPPSLGAVPLRRRFRAACQPLSLPAGASGWQLGILWELFSYSGANPLGQRGNSRFRRPKSRLRRVDSPTPASRCPELASSKARAGAGATLPEIPSERRPAGGTRAGRPKSRAWGGPAGRPFPKTRPGVPRSRAAALTGGAAVGLSGRRAPGAGHDSGFRAESGPGAARSSRPPAARLGRTEPGSGSTLPESPNISSGLGQTLPESPRIGAGQAAGPAGQGVVRDGLSDPDIWSRRPVVFSGGLALLVISGRVSCPRS